MATYRAIEVACAALARTLGDVPRPAELASHRFAFRVVGAGEIAGLLSGVGILPYRIRVDRSVRPAPPNVDLGASGLTVDVELLVVVAAADAATRLSLTGWVLRTLHDQAVLRPGPPLDPPVFTDAEPVRVAVDDMSRAELLQLWDVLGLAGSDALPLPCVLTGLVIDPAAADAMPRNT